jgi:hypothetical protein
MVAINTKQGPRWTRQKKLQEKDSMNNVAQHEEKGAVLSSIFISSVIAFYWYECGYREKRREGKGLFRIM